LGNSVNTIEEDNNYAFTVEETSDNKRNMNVSEYEEILDKLWSKEEFEKEVED